MGSRKKHSSHLWKDFNGREMVPDRGFVKQLRTLCPTLNVVWDRGSNVWEVWDFPEDGKEPYSVMRIQTEGKSYRELGTDVLLKMQQNIFFMNNLTPKQICDYLDEQDNQVMRRKEQDFRNKIYSISRDTFLYTHNILQVQVPRKLKIEREVCGA